MVTLINQLKEDIQEYFESTQDYADLIVKEKFAILPKVSYPCIYIEEINNTDNEKYHDETEEVTSLSYIFTINATQGGTLSAIGNVREIANLLDTYLKGDRYKSLRRIGGMPMKPLIGDDTVMTGYLTYTCDVEIKTNTIYRRK